MLLTACKKFGIGRVKKGSCSKEGASAISQASSTLSMDVTILSHLHPAFSQYASTELSSHLVHILHDSAQWRVTRHKKKDQVASPHAVKATHRVGFK